MRPIHPIQSSPPTTMPHPPSSCYWGTFCDIQPSKSLLSEWKWLVLKCHDMEKVSSSRAPGDELAKNWNGKMRVKSIHPVRVVGQVRWKNLGSHHYSGIFKGAEHGLARWYLPLSKSNLSAPRLGNTLRTSSRTTSPTIFQGENLGFELIIEESYLGPKPNGLWMIALMVFLKSL